MYKIIITDSGENPEAIETCLEDEEGLGLDEETASAISNGELIHFKTVEDATTADKIAGELEECGLGVRVKQLDQEHVVSGEVTFEKSRPERSVSVVAIDVSGRNDQELGRTTLADDNTYKIQYRIDPDRRIDLVVRAVTGESTLAESDPIPDAGVEETVSLTVPAKNMPVPDVAQGNDLFEFMMVRPADTSNAASVESGEGVGDTAFLEALTTAREEGGRDEMVNEALDYMRSDDFVTGPDSGGGELSRLDERLATTRNPTEHEVRSAIEETFGMPPAAVVNDSSFQRTRKRLTNSLAATSVTPGSDGHTRQNLTRGVRLARLVEKAADSGVKDVQEFLERPVALPEGLFPLPSPSTTGADSDGSSEEDGDSREIAKLHQRLESIRKAKAELRAAEFALAQPSSGRVEEMDEGSSSEEESTSDRRGEMTQSGRTQQSDNVEQMEGTEQSGNTETGDEPDQSGEQLQQEGTPQSGGEDSESEPLEDGGMPRLNAPDRLIDALSPETRDLLDEVATGGIPTDLDTAASRLRETESELGSELLRRTLEPISGRTARIGDSFRTTSTIRDGEADGEMGESGFEIGDYRTGDFGLPEGPSEFEPVFPPGRVPVETGLVNVLGVGVMKTVKRETARYEMGELAHVENVLEGEYKKRVHEREEVTEETLITEEETTESQKRDLRTSERFEMERESQETVQQKSSIEAGVKVSASYGPTVEVDAHTNYSRNQARKRSEQSSRRYSREVTKQTVNRIQRRKFRREVKKERQRVTETNTHELDNKGDDENISGIYRWVDKIMRAQVFDEGKRLMLEFIVPEPAAFYRQAKSSNPAEQIMMQKPEPPTYMEVRQSDNTITRTKRPLEPGDLDNSNYQHYASRYGAMDISPPPDEVIKKGTKISKKGAVPKQSKKPIYKNGSVSIPKGYRAGTASIGFADVVRNERDWRWKLQATVGDQAASVGWRGTWGVGGLRSGTNENIVENIVDEINSRLTVNVPEDPAEKIIRSILEDTPGVTIGSQQGEITEGTFTYERQLDMDEKQRPVALNSAQDATPQTVILPYINGGAGSGGQGGVPVTVFAYNVLGFGVTVTVSCYRTAEHYKNWQIETYKKIRTAFEKELSKYRKKLAEARSEEGVDIEGNAPEENRRIEREELKRLAISMMREQHLDMDFIENIADDDDDIENIPGVEFSDLRWNQRKIQFFEQAFEWTDMTYVFYPYFWTDRDDWPELEQYEANDPAFESFLSAGAARVIVPVRPGFFDTVLWFLQSGELDFDPPDIGDPQYVPIVTEIKEQQGVDEDAKPVGDPWAVRVPTELVKVQQSEKLPDLPPDV